MWNSDVSLVFVYADDATFCNVQQFEKAVLVRSSRSRSEPNAKVAEENSEKDRGTDSEEDKDEETKTKHQRNGR